ncbi:ClbS/DfsB family four-helix bundle protein, partial [Acinetobacter baumannii]|uniref:ClbS/DfsB family four-helix bundle protein n=2 Tax=Moraxellaceae TaxID=468 RepID=UPI003AF554F7
VIAVDKTPSQNISYQLGWVSLLLEWEKDEKEGQQVITPKKGFKWNNLGVLYQEFYQTYDQYSLDEKKELLSKKVSEVIDWVQSLAEDELFLPNQRKWATTPAKWPVYK